MLRPRLYRASQAFMWWSCEPQRSAGFPCCEHPRTIGGVRRSIGRSLPAATSDRLWYIIGHDSHASDVPRADVVLPAWLVAPDVCERVPRQSCALVETQLPVTCPHAFAPARLPMETAEARGSITGESVGASPVMDPKPAPPSRTGSIIV